MNSIVARRLAAHRLVDPSGSVVELVQYLGAVQAQDRAGCRWAVGLRTGATDAEVQRALDEARVLRTHAMRGTWQLVAPADVHWLLGLVGPRVLASAKRRFEELGLDDRVAKRSREVLEKALSDGHHRTRDEMAEVLNGARIDTSGQRLSHLLYRAELEGLLCNGRMNGKQTTHALLRDRAPATPPLDRDEALARLALRYFGSRGPATLQDFAWWSSLTVTDAKAATGALGAALEVTEVDGRKLWSTPGEHVKEHEPLLLPPFDEWLVAYRDRDDTLDPKHVAKVNAGGGLLDACIVVDGRVIGTWSRTLSKKVVVVEHYFFEKARRARLDEAEARYRRFLSVSDDAPSASVRR